MAKCFFADKQTDTQTDRQGKNYALIYRCWGTQKVIITQGMLIPYIKPPLSTYPLKLTKICF